MKSKSFNVGDKVFAKVKGYPTWPAKIESLNGKRYNVYFYGTGEAGVVKSEDLYLYAQNKHKFIKTIKRKDYNEAVEQIEAEILAEGGIILEQKESSTTVATTTSIKTSKKSSEATVVKSETFSDSVKLDQSSKSDLESEKERKTEVKPESEEEMKLDSQSEPIKNEQMEVDKNTEQIHVDEELSKLKCDESSIEMVNTNKADTSFSDSVLSIKTNDLSVTSLPNNETTYFSVMESFTLPKLVPISTPKLKNASISLSTDTSILESVSDLDTSQKQTKCLEITDDSVLTVNNTTLVEPIDDSEEIKMSDNTELKRNFSEVDTDESDVDYKRLNLASDEKLQFVDEVEKVPVTTTVLTTTVNNSNQKQEFEADSNQGPVVIQLHQKATVSNRVIKTEHPMEEERRDLISRSGRKIKPKKYLDDEEVTENITAVLQSAQARRVQRKESEAVPILQKDISPGVNNISNVPTNTLAASPFGYYFYISKKRIQYLLSKDESIEEHAMKRNITNIEISDYEFEMSLREILLVKLQNEPNYIGIKFKLNRPRQFKNELERWQWDKEAMKNALEMKNKLENNESSIHDVNKDMLVLNLELLANDIIRNERLQMLKSKDNRIVLLKTEMAFVTIMDNIKSNLGLEFDNVDTQKAIDLMDKMISMRSRLNAIILKKRSECIEAINKLRGYVGNVNKWNLDIEKLFPFNQNATLIREKANLLLKYFQQICKIPEQLPFLEEYNKQRDVFNAALDNYPNHTSKVALTCEPYSMEYYNDQFDDAVGKFFQNLI